MSNEKIKGLLNMIRILDWIIGIDQELKRGKMSMFLTATVPRFSEFQQNPQITYLLGAKFFHSTPKPQLKLQLDAIGGLLHVSIICNDDNVNKYCKSKWIFVTESLTLPEDKHGFLAEFATRLAPEISAIREGLQQLANFDSRRKEWDPTTVQEALTLLGDFKDLSKDKAFGALYWFMKCLEIATSQQDFVNCNELFHSVHHKVFD